MYKFGPQPVPAAVRADLKLWKEILLHATTTGVSINNITFTIYDHIIYTDACEFGIGGYNPQTGRAWRHHLPESIQKLHINTLEYLAALVGIWLETIQNTNSFKILCMTDNSSALAWLHKGNFRPKDQKIHETISRKLARLLLQHGSSLYSQHVQGKNNVIADSLSHDHHIHPTHLSYSLTTLFPTQTKENLEILSQLPQEITSWIDSLTTESTRSKVSHNKPSNSNLGHLESTFDDDIT